MEIETYWLNGKRDKDGNAQAACPQFETRTIDKSINQAANPGSEAPGEDKGQVRGPRSPLWEPV